MSEQIASDHAAVEQDAAREANQLYQTIECALVQYSRIRPKSAPLSIEAAACWIIANQIQRSVGIRGDFLEAGVEPGGSALLMLSLLQRGERAVLVDLKKSPTFVARAAAIGRGEGDWYDFFECSTESPALESIRTNRFRAVHIDASHLYDAVLSDIRRFSPLAAEPGLLILDDIFQPRWPDVTRAMMQFLEDDQWRVLLLGFNKAYLVRKAHKPAYARHFSRVLSALKDKLGNFRYWDDVPFKNYQVIATAGSVDSLRKASQLHESSGKLVPVCLPQHAETRAANHATASQKLPFLGTFLDSVSHKNSFCEKRRMRAYQKEILEGGRLEILSPITGANTVAEASVLLPNGSIGYRFGGDKGFWIIADELRFGYPLCALVLEETDEVFPVSQCNQKVLATVSSNLGLLRAGLAEPKPAASEQPPRSKLVIGDVNFAHHLWNELSGLADWAACANSSALERMTVYPLHEPLAAIETLVPALREAEVVRGEAQVRNVNSAPGIATRVGSTLVSSEIRKQVISVLSQSADQTILAHFDGFLRKYPLFWVSVRPEKRTCVNQLEFLSALIGSLLSEFPGSGIMVDGFSLPNDYPENPEYSNKKAFFENKVSSSADFIRELFRNLELNYFNEVHERVRSISGLRLAETLTLAGRVHFYVSHAGTSQHKVAWVHDKIGVVHSCRAGLSQAARKWVADQVEGGIEPIMLSPNRVLDHISRDASSLEHHNLDYLIRDVPAAVTDIIRAARSALAAQSTARELDRS